MSTFSAKRYALTYSGRPRKKRPLKIVLFIFALFVVYRITVSFFIASYQIKTDSMQPAYQNGDTILISPFPYGMIAPFSNKWISPIRKPDRGDIVILVPNFYKAPSNFVQIISPVVSFFTFGLVDPAKEKGSQWNIPLVVRRIVGIPGDRLVIRDNIAYIRPFGSQNFNSEYSLSQKNYPIKKENITDNWPKDFPFSGNILRETALGEGEYFVMGDNRTLTTDSRHWGPINQEQLRGKVLLRIWPFGKKRE